MFIKQSFFLEKIEKLDVLEMFSASETITVDTNDIHPVHWRHSLRAW